ncbi:MAG: response regulator [Elusimicrobiota bacterium]|nr:response regulator [Endomicrobiia bacterium]MDW8165754.1 response regulator [Elusimicrobiota bacterium]
MKKVFIVEDDLEIQDLMKFSFQQVNYEVYQAYNGKEALQKVKLIMPDIIILDVMMPEMNGFEVIEHLRGDPDTCLIPVIMLTSLGHTKDKLTGIKLGADEYLVKPIEPYELIFRAENLIKKYYENVNTVTHLLGLNSLENYIKELLENKKEFIIILLDITNFKPYNLRYGFKKGDEVLKFFSSILRTSVANYGGKCEFLFHLEADKFCIITQKSEIQTMIENIFSLFDNLSEKIYDKEDILNKFFTYKLEENIELKSPLMKIAAGVLKVGKDTPQHYAEVLYRVKEILNTAKQKSKESGEHSIVIL